MIDTGSGRAGVGQARAGWDRLRRFSSGLAAPGRGLWGVIAALALIDGVWLGLAGIAIDPAGGLVTLGALAALLGLAGVFGTVKPEPTLRGMALATACLLAVTVTASLLHYLAATLALPFADPALARVEAGLGFDWTAWIAWLAAHPELARGLALAYHSSGPQVALVVIVLAATRRLARLWAFVRLFSATLLCVVVVSGVWPALGPYAFYAPRVVPGGHLETVGALWHLEPLARLRAGAMDMIALGDIRGLVTFPSFHVCLAALSAWALAPLPVIGPAAILLNAAIAVASVGAGGHYLPDVLAGAVLAAAVLLRQASAGRLLPAPRRPAPSPAPAAAGAPLGAGTAAAAPPAGA